MHKVGRYILIDLLKNRIAIGYLVLCALIGWGTFMLGNPPEKALLILMQVTLAFIPLFTMLFTATYYYNSLEFIELLLAQPVGRSAIFRSFYSGLSVMLVAGYSLGLCLPLLFYHPSEATYLLVGGGIMLILIFTALALLISVKSKDKVRGLGFALLLWALFAFLYDGLLLFIMYRFADYPVEKAILVLSFFNPIDITRILIIMKTDASAMLGLSGAVFQQFFGSTKGMLVSLFVLLTWIVLPYVLARRGFVRKDM